MNMAYGQQNDGQYRIGLVDARGQIFRPNPSSIASESYAEPIPNPRDIRADLHLMLCQRASLESTISKLQHEPLFMAADESIILDVLRGLLTEASSHIGSLVDAYSASLSERRHP